ncbi:SDR family oxidoreductase [Flavobacterium sp.]|uniref:SDR family oxidoreductase n=1 Tax=Flavobacterium sp. TaxID=239 RepID=UPI003BE252FE
MQDFRLNHEKKFHHQKLDGTTILITGGAGFIGSHLAEYFVAHKAKKVIVLDNLSTGNIKNIEPLLDCVNFQFVEGDIRNIDLCKSLFSGVDLISHQAALGSVPRSIKDPITTNEVNVGGFLSVLVAARDNQVKRIVYAASSSTYGDSLILPKKEEIIGNPLSPYAITKYVNELYANIFHKTYGLDTVGLRYFNVFGPRQDPFGAYAAVIPKFIMANLQNMAPSIDGDGNQTRDFTYIDNIIQLNIKALFTNNPEALNHVYNGACSDRISVNDLWNAINKLSNKSIDPIYGSPRKGDVRDSLASIEKAKLLLDYNPTVNVLEGLKETFSYFLEQHQKNNK